jgi:hypothetical protein
MAPVSPGATQMRAVYYPWVPVRVRRDGHTTPRMLLLLDSGADFCVLKSEIGVTLGITDIRAGEPCQLRGLGRAPVNSWFHDVEVEFEGRVFASRFALTSEPLPIPGLLGRKGFFDQFKSVSFNENSRFVTLKY